MKPGRTGAALSAEAGLTRRQFLVGGGATVAGLAALGIVGWRSWTVRDRWYRLSGAYGEAGTPPPKYPVFCEYGTLASVHLGANAEYGIAYPPGLPRDGSSPDSAVPVCICLPGRGRTPQGIIQERLRLGDVVADAAEKRGVSPFAVAALQASDTYWHGREAGDDAMAMLFDEFIPLLRRDFGLGGPLAIMGWSMGGYGALRAAELRPADFRGVCAVSPALWESYEAGVGDAFDDAADYAAHDVYAGVERLRGLPVRIDCGTKDPFYASTKAFAESLPEPPAGGFEAGGHNDAYWSRVAPAEADFIGGALSRAGSIAPGG